MTVTHLRISQYSEVLLISNIRVNTELFEIKLL